MRHPTIPNAALPTVLVVEDSTDDEKLTLRGLERCGIDISVHVAKDGAEALAALTGGFTQSGLTGLPA